MYCTEMGESKAASAKRPTIALPPRSSFENWLSGGAAGQSPGPMTLVSSFFSDGYSDSGCRTFTQLLAGAMASPVAVAAGLSPSFFMGNPNIAEDSSKEEASRDEGGDEKLGFKQNRPTSLAVARSPVFMIPPGLSPSGLLNSPGFFSPGQGPFGMSHQQALAQVTAQAVLSKSSLHIQNEFEPPNAEPAEPLIHNLTFMPTANLHQQPPLLISHPNSVSITELSDVSHSYKKSQPPASVDKPADDGYNWRKYGQKQVKSSEYPRSYYKCTHANCPVKKKVERSFDGQITEIIYKGQHNHELPQTNKRARDNSDKSKVSQAKAELSSQGYTSVNKLSYLPHDSLLERDHESTQTESLSICELNDIDDGETRRGKGTDDESNPKRRSIEGRVSEPGTSGPASSQKTVTESRIIVQTKSEVDLLDDGYKWRKYGQKIVKGNHNPRSYYKCTSAGCTVRKHVERAMTDAKAVITTYEGKHNHDLPAPRNGSRNTAPQLKLNNFVDDEREVDSRKQRSISFLQLKEERVAG